MNEQMQNTGEQIAQEDLNVVREDFNKMMNAPLEDSDLQGIGQSGRVDNETARLTIEVSLTKERFEQMRAEGGNPQQASMKHLTALLAGGVLSLDNNLVVTFEESLFRLNLDLFILTPEKLRQYIDGELARPEACDG